MRFVSSSYYMSKILLCYFHCCRSFMNFFAGSTHFFTRKFFHSIHIYDNDIHMRLEAWRRLSAFPVWENDKLSSSNSSLCIVREFDAVDGLSSPRLSLKKALEGEIGFVLSHGQDGN